MTVSVILNITPTGYLLGFADHAVVLAEGQVVAAGSLDVLKASNSYVQALKIATSATGIEPAHSSEISSYVDNRHDVSQAAMAAASDAGEALNDIKRQGGDFSVYAYYIAAAGVLSVSVFFVMVMLFAFCREFPGEFSDISH